MAIYGPRLPRFVHKQGYQSYVKNLCVNFQASRSAAFTSNPMPILQIIPPANMYAVASDHDYLAKHPEEMIIDSLLNVTQISAQERDQIERSTRGQAQSNNWSRQRGLH